MNDENIIQMNTKPPFEYPSFLDCSNCYLLFNTKINSYYLSILENPKAIIIDRIYFDPFEYIKSNYIQLEVGGIKHNYKTYPDYYLFGKEYDQAVRLTQKYLALI